MSEPTPRGCPFRPHPYCAWGVIVGAGLGLLTVLGMRWMGYTVTHGPRDALVDQLLWHAVWFGFLGWWSGLFFYQKKQMEWQAKVIETQFDELKRSQEHLVQSEKLAVVGALAASMAHEIRNPLGIIQSSAALVAEDLPPEHPGHRPLAFISDEIERLNGLIRHILAFSKPKAPVLGPTRLNDLVERALAFLEPEFRKRKIEVSTTLDRSIPSIHADADQVHQVLVGLLINAAQAIRERGTVAIQTRLRTRKEGPAIELSVRDNGAGIAPGNLERIFEPFFTTKEEGTGLGLAVARQIVTGHGGRIWGESPPGQGATFHLLLPLDRPAALEPEASAVRAA